MRIKVYTFYWGKNFGAMLQAWALKRFLEGLGHEVSFAGRPAFPLKWRFRNWNRCPESSILRKTKWIFSCLFTEFLAIGTEDVRYWRLRNFHRHFLGSAPTGWSVSDCNCAVFGSDQIWNPSLTEEDTMYYLGETIPAAIPKISYAASVGDCQLLPEARDRLARSCASFAALSVRESIDGLVDRQGRMPTVVLDPTLLLSREDYRELECPHRLQKGPYVLVYALALTSFVIKTAETLAKSVNLPIVYVTTNYYGRRYLPVRAKLAETPSSLLAYIRDADYVISSSFHGTVFSLVYQKRFISLVESESPIGTRAYALLESFKLSGHIITRSSCFKEIKEVFGRSPSSMVLDVMDSNSDKHRQWLRQAVNEVKRVNTVTNIVY